MTSSSDATSPTLLILEFSLTAFMFVISFGWPGIGQNFFRRMERWFGKLARRKWLAVISVALSVLLLRLAILPLFPVPLPFCSDDFSFLLAGDTFGHGRLTNLTPAMWTHFETIHVTMKPTYQSMYFPGQGLILAASKVVFGNSWTGLLIVSALMCAALCWMLQAWLPASWALLGGMIAVLRLGVFSYWTNTYHAGGSLAALGGALILGALPRLIRTTRLRYAMLMGIGVAILVLTRPYEGILLCLPVGVVLGNWIWKGKNRPGVASLTGLAAATLAFGIAAVAWMGYYDYRAFGNPLTAPYTIDRNTYAIAPYYVWQQPRPEPTYRYAEMRAFYHEGELSFYNHIHSVKGFVPYTLEKVGFVILFYAGFALFPPLIMVRRIFLDRRIRFLVVCVLVLAGGMVIEIFLLPHYVAPFTAAFYAIGLQAMRHMRFWKPEGKPMGLALLRLTIVVCVLMAGIRVVASPLHFGPNEFPPSDWNESWFGPEHFGTERAQIEARLSQLPGGQLAIVRYSPDHNPGNEWVYNRADIDGSKVVWARDADAADNLELIHYYQNRKVWLVEPDLTPARVSPYAISERAAHPTP
ncbi:MAG: hypothetical protein ABR860_00210 [Terracidiphilus sp.]|jgi:hypothetical protein